MWWQEWFTKLKAFLGAAAKGSEEMVGWAVELDKTATEEEMDLSWGVRASEVKVFASQLYTILVNVTEDRAFEIVQSVGGGEGLEALRLLRRRFDPKTPGTKRAILKAILNITPAKKVMEVEEKIMKLEDLVKRYEAMTKEKVSSDLTTTILMDLTRTKNSGSISS